MRVLVLGGDGYLGWPTALYFSNRGDEVAILDNFAKRKWELEEGIEPLWIIPPLHRRVSVWQNLTGKAIKLFVGDLCDSRFAYHVLEAFKPDTIIHYGEQPSAPYSMQTRITALNTQINNVAGTLNLLFAMQRHCPNAHLIKLGTMGEYGTPNIDIEEGWINIEHNGRTDRVLYPKKPGSFYHLSKVHDSANIEFACRIWGVKATDLNQGVVYGIDTNETLMHPDLKTSFHYDGVFGTVLNRFLVQAATDNPLTVYGKGGQTRGFLNIRDTIQCVAISADNPGDAGDFRVFNQFTEQFSVNDLAKKVIDLGQRKGLKVIKKNIDNPRVEMEEHYYNAVHTELVKLGLEPTLLNDEVLDSMFDIVLKNRSAVDESTFFSKNKMVAWSKISMSYEEWHIPKDLLESPAVTNRNLFAQKISSLDVDEILAKYVYFNSNQLKSFFDIIFNLITPVRFEGTGLELGAGVCVFSALMCRKFKHIKKIYSVELVSDVIKLLQPKTISKMNNDSISQIISVHGSFDEINLPDNSLDFVIEWAALHHSDDLDITLNEIARVTKKGGTLLAIDRAQDNSMTGEQKKYMLDLEYSSDWKRENGYDSKPLSRRQNGEHEIRLNEWLGYFSNAGFSLEKRLELRIVSLRNIIYGATLSLPYKLRRILNLWPSRVRLQSGEWSWMCLTLLGINGNELFIKAPRNYTLFLLKKK